MVVEFGNICVFGSMVVLWACITVKAKSIKKILTVAAAMLAGFPLYVSLLGISFEPLTTILAGHGIFWKVWLFYGYVVGSVVGAICRVVIFAVHRLRGFSGNREG
jgi:hypothetical protein